MTRMMAKLILFNYLPCVEEFRHAMILFLLEYDEYINNHIRENYLDPDQPHKLGGRAAGLQGQVGSTNGGEKKGGGWKSKCKELIRRYRGDASNNFLFMMEGMSM